MENILVTGASGFIGSHVCNHLSSLGYNVYGLSRFPEYTKAKVPILKSVYFWDGLSKPSWFTDLEINFDAVINLMGEPVVGRWTKSKKNKMWQSRVLATRYLSESMNNFTKNNAKLISMSAIGFYPESDVPSNEDSDSGQDFLSSLVVEWEKAAMVAKEYGVNVTCLRTGIVLDPTGGALRRMLLPAKFGLGGNLGSGNQWWSWVHIMDLMQFIVYILQNNLSGIYNVTSPVPIQQKKFARILGKTLKRPAFFWIPEIVIRLIFGEFSQELLGSRRIIPTNTLSSGYVFSFSDLNKALRELLA